MKRRKILTNGRTDEGKMKIMRWQYHLLDSKIKHSELNIHRSQTCTFIFSCFDYLLLIDTINKQTNEKRKSRYLAEMLATETRDKYN